MLMLKPYNKNTTGVPKFDGCTFIIHSQRIKWLNKNNEECRICSTSVE